MSSSTRLRTIPTSQLATITGGFLNSGAPVPDPGVARGSNAPQFSGSKTGAPSGSKTGAPSGSKTHAPFEVSKPSGPPFPPWLIAAPAPVLPSLQDSHR